MFSYVAPSNEARRTSQRSFKESGGAGAWPSSGSEFSCTIAWGLLRTSTTVITKVGRGIALGVWVLRKQLERFEALLEQGLFQLELEADAVRLVAVIPRQ